MSLDILLMVLKEKRYLENSFMNSLVKKILVLVFIYSSLYSCDLCKLEVPVVDVSVDAKTIDKNIEFDVKWKFSKQFTAEAMFSYDINSNKIYSDSEILEAKKSIDEYIKKDNLLTFVKYLHKDSVVKTTPQLDKEFISSSLIYKDFAITYSYKFRSNIIAKKDYMLYFILFDKGNFFDFSIGDFTLDNNIPFGFKNHKEYIEFTFDEDMKIDDKKIEKPTKEIEKELTFLDRLSIVLKDLKTDIEELLIDIKQNNSLISYLWLLLFSFLYGVIHAIGPGHGKSLVSAYFLGKDSSIMKALNISILIGVVHTFSAFLLTFTIYYILNSVLKEYFNDIELIATQISAIVIIVIALYMIYKKLPKQQKMSFKVAEKTSISLNPNINNISDIHTEASSCSCSGCKTNSTDLGVVLSAGIVPCAGTVTIFIFTMSLGIYFVGFLSAVFMSIGMSFIIFIMAYLSIKVRKKGSSNHKIQKFFEYGSLVFILALGVSLLLFTL
jgi:nickel/cobalt transporter (NicO) family protein